MKFMHVLGNDFIKGAYLFIIILCLAVMIGLLFIEISCGSLLVDLMFRGGVAIIAGWTFGKTYFDYAKFKTDTDENRRDP